HVARFHPVETVRKRHPRTSDRRRARTAISLNDVAVDRDLALAQRREIDYRTKRAPDEPLNLDCATALLSGACLAPRAFRGGTRKHAVFGGYPTAALALEPGRQAFLQAGRDQDMGVTKLHKTRALSVFHNPALKRNGAQ